MRKFRIWSWAYKRRIDFMEKNLYVLFIIETRNQTFKISSWKHPETSWNIKISSWKHPETSWKHPETSWNISLKFHPGLKSQKAGKLRFYAFTSSMKKHPENILKFSKNSTKMWFTSANFVRNVIFPNFPFKTKRGK